MKVTRELARAMRAEIGDALGAVAEKYGFMVEVGSMSYSDARVKASVAFAVAREDGLSQAAANDWSLCARAYGLEDVPFGFEFTRDDGHKFKVTGLNTRSAKWPVLCERDDGRAFKFPASTVLLYWRVAKGGK